MNDPVVYKKRFHIFLLLTGMIFLSYFFAHFGYSNEDYVFKKRHFDNLKLASIEASSVYVFDSTANQVIFERQATTPRPLASITKIMTALVASELWPPEEHVRVTLPYLTETGETVMQSDLWKMRDLIPLMMTRSSNEAAEAISVFAPDFIDRMNKKAKEIGMWKAEFFNASGLDVHTAKAGGYGTAEEVAFLTLYTLKKFPYVFETTTKRVYNATSEEGRSYMIENTNPLAVTLEGLVASKTGFTDLARGNLVFTFNVLDEKSNPHLIVVSLLNSSKEGRFQDADNIIKALKKDFTIFNQTNI